MECLYCMETITKFATCAIRCGASICWTCLSDMIQINPKTLPVCDCTMTYLYSDIKNNITTEALYNLKHQGILTFWNNKISTRVKFTANINHYKENWLNDLPKAAKIAVLSFLMPELHEYSIKKITNFNGIQQSCPNTLCKGMIKKGETCEICKALECTECIATIFSDDIDKHVCDKNNIDTAQELKKLQQCPKCNVRVIRIKGGCSAMTCSACGTNFNYSSGKMQTNGSEHVILLSRHFNKMSKKLDKLLNKYNSTLLIKVEENCEDLALPDKPDLTKVSMCVITNWVDEQLKVERNKVLYETFTKNIESLEFIGQLTKINVAAEVSHLRFKITPIKIKK